MGSDLRGRKSADACYNFALSGMTNANSNSNANSNHNSNRLFESLICIGIHELKRVGNRASFPPKYILQMMEKFAASGIGSIGDRMQGSSSSSSYSGTATATAAALYQLGGVCLEKKGYDDKVLLDQLRKGSFGFHSDRPLLWLWRFSARQKKITLSEYYEYSYRYLTKSTSKSKLMTSTSARRSKEHRDRPWHEIFSDVNRPIVVDVGSGMGASILNLASIHSHRKDDDTKKGGWSDDDDDDYDDNDSTHTRSRSRSSGEIFIDWSECNYVGADLNPSMVSFGNGVVFRNEKMYNGRVSFFHMEALELLTKLQSYPGNIAMVMIHFPSPYRLMMAGGGGGGLEADMRSGNSQLPTSIGNGFMVSRGLLELISVLLLPKSNSVHSKDDAGVFLFQTKCEDVAVRVKTDCLSLRTMECISCKCPVKNIDRIYDDNGKREGKGNGIGNGRPKRVEEWMKIDPCAERAEGKMWSSIPLLPTKGRPETEVQCEYENTIVHRCMLRPRDY